MAEAIRDGLRLEAIAADFAGDGDAALELLSVNAYDVAVLDRDIPGPTGDDRVSRKGARVSGPAFFQVVTGSSTSRFSSRSDSNHVPGLRRLPRAR
jgi:hypothetical protein